MDEKNISNNSNDDGDGGEGVSISFSVILTSVRGRRRFRRLSLPSCIMGMLRLLGHMAVDPEEP